VAPSGSQIEISALAGGVTRVSLAGEVDLTVTPRVELALHDVMGKGNTRLVVDLTDATFIDSTLLGLLIETFRRLQRRRGRLVVLCPNQ
jgi:anti-sigma B factor antagonist